MVKDSELNGSKNYPNIICS